MILNAVFMLAYTFACFGQVITDPVELWSPPESEARLQKNYFDEKFGPFYRSEQLIITAPHMKAYNYTQLPYFNNYTFGPVLHKSILHQVCGENKLSY